LQAIRAEKNKKKKAELKKEYLKKQGLIDKNNHFDIDDDDTGFLEVDEEDEDSNEGI
jgi:hypothetical protein